MNPCRIIILLLVKTYWERKYFENGGSRASTASSTKHQNPYLLYSQSIFLKTIAAARNTKAAKRGLAKIFLENLVAKITFSSALVSMLSPRFGAIAVKSCRIVQFCRYE